MSQAPADTHAVLDLTARRAQEGDLAAFEELYRENVGRIHALAVRMSGSRARADELTQDVFVKAWTRLDTYRCEARFSTWLRSLAVRAIIDGMRSDKRRRARQERAAPPRSTPPARMGRVDLERAIGGLPPKARQVFVLHDIEGYRHDEIGEMLGIRPGTARGQLHRARQLLREALT